MYRLWIISVMFVCGIVFTDCSPEEGYSAGCLPDCPGSEIPGIISPEELNYLTISVQGSTAIFSSKKEYNYYQMEDMAKDPSIDLSKTTVMYVGGFMDHPSYPFALTVGISYKKLGYNVFLLNTNKFTTTAYPVAASNMRTIGKHVAEMLVILTKHGLKPSNLQLLGLSLGSQTMGFIAKNYKLMTGMKISRLTGLDPSGPCFRNLGPKDRLDKSDSDFVDVINTNIDGYGMAAPIGHVNFYVNGGEFQPGDVLWAPCNVLCSHIRSFTLWIAALNNPNSFIAMKCDSVQEARNRDCYGKHPVITNILGLNTKRSEKGIFYLATGNNYPYFMGLKGLEKKYDFFDSKLNLNKSAIFSFEIQF